MRPDLDALAIHTPWLLLLVRGIGDVCQLVLWIRLLRQVHQAELVDRWQHL